MDSHTWFGHGKVMEFYCAVGADSSCVVDFIYLIEQEEKLSYFVYEWCVCGAQNASFQHYFQSPTVFSMVFIGAFPFTQI